MKAIFENKATSEILRFNVLPNENATSFWLEVEGLRTPLSQTVNATEMGLALVMEGSDFEERISYLRSTIDRLSGSDREEVLEDPRFRAAFDGGFTTSSWKQVAEFCEELNKVIATKMPSEFSFVDFDLDTDLKQILGSNMQ